MRMKTLQLALIAAALGCAGPALADHGKDKKKHHEATPAAESAKSQAKGGHEFNQQERDEIQGYFRANPSARGQLPPGLAKKNKIPPGWQKKVARGEHIPDDVWAHRVPLPHEVESRLPVLERGEVRVRINDRVVRVAEKTREVLDVIELAREAAR